jgi:Fur family ferric uptake transcriptional regulator
MREEQKILDTYIRSKGLRSTPQRHKILEIFLDHEAHVSAEELLALVQKKYPDVSQATVFRAVKVFCAAGLADKVHDEDGVVKYEHAYKHKKHGHLMCSQCGAIIEFDDPGLQAMQTRVSRQHHFQAQHTTIKIVGLCATCAKKTVC